MSALMNKHIQHQSITKAIFQNKLHVGTVCQTTFLIQTNSISPKLLGWLNQSAIRQLVKTRRKSKGLETATNKEIQPILEKDKNLAKDYYFKKALLEVRHFVKETQ